MCSSASLLQLVDLVSELARRILQIFLLYGCERAQDDQFEHEVGEADQNDEVVQSGLDLAHLGAPPVRDPVAQPEEVSQKRDRQQQHQLQFIVLTGKEGKQVSSSKD